MEKKNKKNKQSKKKVIGAVVGVIILLIAVIVAIGIYRQSQRNYEIEEVKEYQYFKIYEEGKYGVINKEGNIIIEPQYAMIMIPNPSKPVFVCYEVYDEINKNYETIVYNDKKEQLYSQYEQVQPFIFSEITNELPFEKSILKTKQGDKYGIIDFSGKEIVEPIYESIESLPYKEGMLLIKQNGKYGLMNMKGTIIVPTEYDLIEADGYYNASSKNEKEGYIVANKTEQGYRYGYINSQGKKMLEVEYNEIERINSILEDKEIYVIAMKNGKIGVYQNQTLLIPHDYEKLIYNKVNNLFTVNRNGKQGVIDLQGKIILNTEYDDIQFSGKIIKATKDGNTVFYNDKGEEQEKSDFVDIIYTTNENYFITINQEGKYGVIDKQKQTIIQNTFEYIEYAFKNYFICTQNGKLGVVNAEQKYELDFIYNVIQRVQDKNILQTINTENNTMEIYNQDMQKVYSMQNATMYIEDNYIKLVSDVDRQYFDNNGNIISNQTIFPEKQLLAVKQGEKWGFVNQVGEMKVEPKYDMVTEFNQYGYAGIKQDGKWGVINQEGNIIVEPIYEINALEPEFISKYCKQNAGYGFEYYTDELIKEEEE